MVHLIKELLIERKNYSGEEIWVGRGCQYVKLLSRLVLIEIFSTAARMSL